ncbi:unnamed protein product [Amoebophrya sp. A25]|nr:unnamed protein product [Amoebophrya sp. A25]|eukprot:GSA25T00006676001.1
MTVVGGGCQAIASPFILADNIPYGDQDGKNGGWQCGGGSPEHMVWVFCSRDIQVKLVEAEVDDGGQVDCYASGSYTKLIGGGCKPGDSATSPNIHHSAPPQDSNGTAMNSWYCAGQVGDKKVIRALCTTDDVPIEINFASASVGYKNAKCSSLDYRIIGGGCEVKVAPELMTMAAPTFETRYTPVSETIEVYRCGGGGVQKRVAAICMLDPSQQGLIADLDRPIYTSLIVGPISGGTDTRAACPRNMAVVGGGCVAYGGTEPRLQLNIPYGDVDGKNGGWRCKGTTTHSAWVVCSPNIKVYLAAGYKTSAASKVFAETGVVAACPDGREAENFPYRTYRTLLGGGCEPGKETDLIGYSAPKVDIHGYPHPQWRCKSPDDEADKRAWALCTETDVPIAATMWAEFPNAWVGQECPDDYDIIGGGCHSVDDGKMEQASISSHDSGRKSYFTCGGGAGKKSINALCLRSPTVQKQLSGLNSKEYEFWGVKDIVAYSLLPANQDGNPYNFPCDPFPLYLDGIPFSMDRAKQLCAGTENFAFWDIHRVGGCVTANCRIDDVSNVQSCCMTSTSTSTTTTFLNFDPHLKPFIRLATGDCLRVNVDHVAWEHVSSIYASHDFRQCFGASGTYRYCQGWLHKVVLNGQCYCSNATEETLKDLQGPLSMKFVDASPAAQENSAASEPGYDQGMRPYDLLLPPPSYGARPYLSTIADTLFPRIGGPELATDLDSTSSRYISLSVPKFDLTNVAAATQNCAWLEVDVSGAKSEAPPAEQGNSEGSTDDDDDEASNENQWDAINSRIDLQYKRVREVKITLPGCVDPEENSRMDYMCFRELKRIFYAEENSDYIWANFSMPFARNESYVPGATGSDSFGMNISWHVDHMQPYLEEDLGIVIGVADQKRPDGKCRSAYPPFVESTTPAPSTNSTTVAPSNNHTANPGVCDVIHFRAGRLLSSQKVVASGLSRYSEPYVTLSVNCEPYSGKYVYVELQNSTIARRRLSLFDISIVGYGAPIYETIDKRFCSKGDEATKAGATDSTTALTNDDSGDSGTAFLQEGAKLHPPGSRSSRTSTSSSRGIALLQKDEKVAEDLGEKQGLDKQVDKAKAEKAEADQKIRRHHTNKEQEQDQVGQHAEDVDIEVGDGEIPSEDHAGPLVSRWATTTSRKKKSGKAKHHLDLVEERSRRDDEEEQDAGRALRTATVEKEQKRRRKGKGKKATRVDNVVEQEDHSRAVRGRHEGHHHQVVEQQERAASSSTTSILHSVRSLLRRVMPSSLSSWLLL